MAERRRALSPAGAVMLAVSPIGTTALSALGKLNESLKRRGICRHPAEVTGPVLDRLRHSELLARLNGRLFLSTAMDCDELQRLLMVD